MSFMCMKVSAVHLVSWMTMKLVFISQQLAMSETMNKLNGGYFLTNKPTIDLLVQLGTMH